jgi:hypothetical protein
MYLETGLLFWVLGLRTLNWPPSVDGESDELAEAAAMTLDDASSLVLSNTSSTPLLNAATNWCVFVCECVCV